MKKAEEFYEKPFLGLLSDAVFFAQSANNTGDSLESNAQARASILNSCLLLEAAANCCVYALKLNGAFREEVDKLPVISKLDLYLRLGCQKKQLNRGTIHYQEFQELKALRDRLVHPKRIKGKLILESRSSPFAEFEQSKLLGLSRDTEFWSTNDAYKVLTAANRFLDFFFLKMCRHSIYRIKQILIAEENPNISDVIINIDLDHPHLIPAMQKHKVPLKYLGVGKGWGRNPKIAPPVHLNELFSRAKKILSSRNISRRIQP